MTKALFLSTAIVALMATPPLWAQVRAPGIGAGAEPGLNNSSGHNQTPGAKATGQKMEPSAKAETRAEGERKASPDRTKKGDDNGGKAQPGAVSRSNRPENANRTDERGSQGSQVSEQSGRRAGSPGAGGKDSSQQRSELNSRFKGVQIRQILIIDPTSFENVYVLV